MAKKSNNDSPTIVNRRAKFDYELVETFEAGIMLVGTEVKAIRMGRASIAESYGAEKYGDIYLLNANINHYPHAGVKFNHKQKRDRKLLLKKREVQKIIGALTQDRLTLVPTKLYFNQRGLIKCELALAKGKRKIDKRETIKERDWERRKQRKDFD